MSILELYISLEFLQNLLLLISLVPQPTCCWKLDGDPVYSSCTEIVFFQTFKWYSVTSRQTPYTLTSAGQIILFYSFHLKLERIFNRQYAMHLKITFLSILICGIGIECQKSNFCNDAVRERT